MFLVLYPSTSHKLYLYLNVSGGKLRLKSDRLFLFFSGHNNCKIQHPFPVMRTHYFLKTTCSLMALLFLPGFDSWSSSSITDQWPHILTARFLRGNFLSYALCISNICVGLGIRMLNKHWMRKWCAPALESDIPHSLWTLLIPSIKPGKVFELFPEFHWQIH